MDSRFHKVYDSNKLFYYLSAENESNSLVLRLVLKSKVNKSILRQALIKTLDRFPNFRQTPVMDQTGNLYTMDNTQEVKVYPYDPDPVILATDDTNGYLFRVMYEADTIWISAYHALCDGRGFMIFARTLLYHYFSLFGYSATKDKKRFLTPDVPVDPSEMADPFDQLDAEPTANPLKPKEEDDIYLIPEIGRNKGVDQCSHFSLSRYILDTKRLVQLAKEANTTVDTWFHLFLARMIHDHYDTGGKTIAGMGTMDLRPYFDSACLQNMTDLFWVYFTDSLLMHSDDQVCKTVDRLFKKAQINEDVLPGFRAGARDNFSELFSFPFNHKEGLRVLRDHFYTIPDLMVSYFTTNLVRFDLGEDLGPLVKHVDVYGWPIFQCPILFIMSHGNETIVNLSQRNFDRKFALILREAFIKKKLLIKDEMGLSLENDKIRVDSIPVMH